MSCRPLGCALLAATAAAAAPPGKAHVRASLVADVASVRPGEPFHVGLRLEMDPGWHTYWKNPGDAGLPTRITWTLPGGFAAGPIEWPYPSRFSQGPVVSYGYEGEVLLLVRMTPAAWLPTGSVAIAGRADWLECREICLPGRQSLSLALPVSAERPRPSPQAGLFRDARARLPAEADGWSVEATAPGAGVMLLLRPPVAAAPLRSAYFFPEQQERLDHAAPQKLESTAVAYRLRLTLDPNAPHPLAELPGVLVVQDGSGAARALRLALRTGAASKKIRPAGSPPAKEQ
jgi:thiol:disulfide interchange protein DsbD